MNLMNSLICTYKGDTMCGILYTIGSTRIETVDLVQKSIYAKFKNQNFDQIIIFNTKQSFEIN